MSQPAAEPTASDDGVRNYWFLCLAALVVVLLLLLQRGLDMWSLFPVLVGCACVVLHWRLGPLLFLGSLSVLLYLPTLQRPALTVGPAPGGGVVADVALCAAVLAFVAGHYRMLGLVQFIFPRDPRRLSPPRTPSAAPAPRRPPLAVPPQRSPASASPTELVLLLLSLPLWTGLALVCRQWLVPLPSPSEALVGSEWSVPASSWWSIPVGFVQFLEEVLWRGRLLLWVFGGSVLLASSLFGWLAWRRLSPSEAAVYLQDTVWRETRREQRRINSWIVWGRRLRRKEER